MLIIDTMPSPIYPSNIGVDQYMFWNFARLLLWLVFLYEQSSFSYQFLQLKLLTWITADLPSSMIWRRLMTFKFHVKAALFSNSKGCLIHDNPSRCYLIQFHNNDYTWYSSTFTLQSPIRIWPSKSWNHAPPNHYTLHCILSHQFYLSCHKSVSNTKCNLTFFVIACKAFWTFMDLLSLTKWLSIQVIIFHTNIFVQICWYAEYTMLLKLGCQHL